MILEALESLARKVVMVDKRQAGGNVTEVKVPYCSSCHIAVCFILAVLYL